MSKTTKFLKAPFHAIGLDIIRRDARRGQLKLTEQELQVLERFAPQYAPGEHWIAKAGIKTVLDIGAHMGEFAHRTRAILPDAEIICFEPLKEPYSKLAERFAGQPGMRTFNCALGASAGQFEFHHNEFAQSSSMLAVAELHKTSFPFAVKEKIEIVQVRTLSDVVKEIQPKEPLMLKLDVQGFEDKVMAGGDDVVRRAKIIILEVSFLPLYEGGPLFGELYSKLIERGFQFRGHLEQLISPKDGRPLQADAIFCKPDVS